MRKLFFVLILLVCFILTVPKLFANHIINGVIFSSDITEGVKFTIAVGSTPFGVATNPTTNKIYVCNSNDNNVSVIDGRKNFREVNVTVGSDPRYLAVNSKTNKIYVANHLGNTVSVIDGTSNAVISTIKVGQRPFAAAVNSETNKVYITNEGSDQVSVIDGQTNTVIKTISVGQFPQGVAANTKTNKVYIANSNSNTVSIIDGSTDTVVSTIQNVSRNPQDIAIDESANRIFVITSSSGGGSLYIIDGPTSSVINSLSIASNATNVAFHPTTGKVYVTVNFNGTIEVLDGRNLKPVYILGAILSPSGVAVNPTTHLIYVCDLTGNTLKVIEDSITKETTQTPTNPTIGETSSSSSGGIAASEGTSSGVIPPVTGTSTSGGVNPPISNGGNSEELISELSDALTELAGISADLRRTSKFAAPIDRKIKFIIGRINSAIRRSGNPCKLTLNSAPVQLDSILQNLEGFECTEIRKKRCIASNVAEEFLIQLKDSFELIKSIISTDEDGNEIPDVCQ